MGIGQPGMKGKGRDLDGKPDKERHPDNVLETPAPSIKRPHRQCRSAILAALGNELGHVEGMRLASEIQRQDGEQHQHAAEKRIEKKFDRGVFSARATPYADQKVHGQQHEFPKNIKEKKNCCT